MEDSLSTSQSTESIRRQRDSTYGVQSLADTLEVAFGTESTTASKNADKRNNAGTQSRHAARSGSHSSSTDSAKSPESPLASPVRKLKRKLSSRTTSTPLTPLNVEAPSPLPTSAIPSTPTSVSLHSLKLSDEGSVIDETGSQVIASSGEEEDDIETQQGASFSFPQLVMPSIRMPTRRPFTTKGKNMGKLKVLVAGRAGQYTFLPEGFKSQPLAIYADILFNRHRQDLAHPFDCPKLRGYRTCRPTFTIAITVTTAVQTTEVSQTAGRTRSNNETDRDTCQYQALPALVD